MGRKPSFQCPVRLRCEHLRDFSDSFWKKNSTKFISSIRHNPTPIRAEGIAPPEYPYLNRISKTLTSKTPCSLGA